MQERAARGKLHKSRTGYFIRMSVDLRNQTSAAGEGAAVSLVSRAGLYGTGLCGSIEWLLLMFVWGWLRDRLLWREVNMIDTHLQEHPDHRDAEQDAREKGLFCHQHQCPPYAVTHEV